MSSFNPLDSFAMGPPDPARIKASVVYCGSYQPCAPIEIAPPFGLPKYYFVDPCCRGIDTMVLDLGHLLAPMTPFLILTDCLVKLVNIVLAIPDAIGPPPSPFKVMGIVSMISEFVPCVTNLLGLAPLPLPTNILAFARFIRGLMDMMIAILQCLKKLLDVYISINVDLAALRVSLDPSLFGMSACIAQQSASVGEGILALMKALDALLALINAFLGIVLAALPPLKAELTNNNLYPLRLNISLAAPPTDTAGIDALITVLTLVRVAANVLAGGT